MTTNHAKTQNKDLIGQIVDASIIKVDHDHILLKHSIAHRIRVYNYDVDMRFLGQDLREHFRAGEPHKVFIKKQSKTGDLYYGNMSLVKDAPWNRPTFPIEIGNTVAGTVISVFKGGAIVRLNCGLDGFLPSSALPSFSATPTPVDRLLDLGDQVKAKVLAINRKRFNVKISVVEFNDYLQRRETNIRGQKEQKVTLKDGARITIEHTSRVKEPDQAFSQYKALIVEDREEVLNAFAGCLRSLGAKVDTAEAFEDAYRLILDCEYDFFFIDRGLSHGNDGLDLIREVYENSRMARKGTYLFTGEPNGDLDRQELKAIGISDILIKPISSNVLRDILVGSYRPSDPSVKTSGQSADRIKTAVFRTDSLEFNALRFNLDREVENLLSEARSLLPHNALGVFSFDEFGQNITLFFEKGLDKEAVEKNISNLNYTPIKDIFGRGEPVFLGTEDSERYTYLRDIVPKISSLIGFPVNFRGKIKYALVFFRTNSPPFSDNEFQRGLTTAHKLALLLEQEENRSIFEKELVFSLLGRVVTGLNHEMRNRIQPLNDQVETLKNKWHDLGKDAGLIHKFDFLQSVDKGFSRLTNYVENLSNLIELFVSPVTRQTIPEIPLISTIEHYMNLVEPEAASRNVRLVLNYDKRNIPPKFAFPQLALGQILTNILLNAVQQKDKPLGIIKVEVLFQADESLPIIIDVQDNSCGIHKKNYKRIFDSLFSTKGKDGVGMGLYIASNLALANGAILELKESFVYTGSAFRLRLPYMIQDG